MASLIDTRVDPGTLTVFKVALEETHQVTEITGLDGRYGFSLNEAPEMRKSGVASTIAECYYLNDEEEQVNLTETSITLFNISENQFSCNYGSEVDENGDSVGDNRNFRMGQIFVHSCLLGKEITIKYNGIGSIVNASNIYNSLMPVGYVFAQYPYCLSPEVLYPSLKWEKLTTLYPAMAGAFFRCEGGLALPFNGGVQEQSTPSHTHTWSNTHSHGVVGVQTALNGNTGGFALGSGRECILNTWDTSISGTTSAYGGPRNEVAPLNLTMILWKRIE